MTPQPAMTPQQRALSDIRRSGLGAYRELAAGNASFMDFVKSELIQGALSGLPGLVGFGARAILYPYLFKSCGKRPAVGRGGMIRIPKQISLGDGVLIDDYVTLDVRGADAAITISDRVSLGRFTTVAAKHGSIVVAAGANVGSYCRIATNSHIQIGQSVLVGAYCYIGPGNHTADDPVQPLISSPMEIRGGVDIGEHSWLGTRVTVLDGVKIGKHAIIGAHALVTEDVPDWGVAVGTPAKVIKIRRPD